MSDVQQPTGETVLEHSPAPNSSIIPTLLLPTDHLAEEPGNSEIDANTPFQVPAVPSTEEEVSSRPVKVSAHPNTHGPLGYKAPGLFSQFRFKQHYFWLGDEPISHQHLSGYLRGEKPEIAPHTAAWSTQTGKALLYFDKKVENKGMPAGVLNLSYATDVTKEGVHDFSFKLHNQKHTFQAASTEEQNGWLVAVESAAQQAHASSKDIVAGDNYKNSMTHFGMPIVAAATAGTLEITNHEKSSEVPRRQSSSSSNDRGKNGMNKRKSRSVSRNSKRSSIFGGLLGRKEGNDEKKEVRKEEKSTMNLDRTDAKFQQKEERAEESADKLEIKRQEKLEKEDVKEYKLRDGEGATMVAPRSNGISADPSTSTCMLNTPPHVNGTASFTDVPLQVEGVPQPMQAALVVDRVLAAPVVGESMVAGSTVVDPVIAEPFIERNTDVTDSAIGKVIGTPRGMMDTTKSTKRSSIFGNFFQKVASPSIEKKEHEVAPAVPPKNDPPMTSTIAPAQKPRTSQDEPAHNTAASEGRATSAAPTTLRPVGDRRRSSFLGFGSNSMKKERSIAESDVADETSRALKPSTPSKFGDLFRRPSKTPRAHENEKREVPASTALSDSGNATGVDNLSNIHDTGLSGMTGTKDEIRAVENDNDTTGHAIGAVDAGHPQTMESGTAVHAAA